ncbi:toprim domain-containing protein [Mycolicibacterium austroafricanum]|uniref:Toprim domain-containing protein n=2 Tax=Mycolicibacterium austroafricanum TaxID=39687 RepID=A0ABT8HHU2_MYCAO|nr:toprim domain-containing protein [Mycolicibacterium austroafricanum]MDN4520319.1 toprim domain-containing protein [Mycolicibacterium austroafricanum]
MVKHRGETQASAQCPAHDDSNPSLSISPRRDGKGVVLHCHAGCSTEDVMAALKLSMGDLFDDPKVRAIWSPQRDYRYPDGRVVHRKPGKVFPQSGNKVSTGAALFGSDRIGDAETVFVCEGEKDCEAIEVVGGAAVCSPMGAGKADRADWSPLRGKHVTIVADRDEPGRKHAAQVADLLDGVAASVRIVEAAVGKDAADHLTAGHTLDEFIRRELSGGANATPAAPDHAVDVDKPARRSVAAQVVDLARNEYTLGVTDTDEPFGVSATRPHIAMLLRGGRTGLRAELSRQFFALNDTVPSQQALADAGMVLEGFATRETPRRVYLRAGDSDGAVYLDMGDPDCHVIEIRGGSWRLTNTAPVLFRRTKLTGALPAPQAGDLSKLWEFVGVAEADRPLVVAWLIAALVQIDVPHPILGLLAEQGATKSTVTRVLVSLVDPSAVPLRQPPRDIDGWTTAAAASWVVALDNLSGTVPAWLSDCLCRASTGDGSVKRALYTDSDVAVTSFRRCVIVNGVDLIVDKGDLAERVLPVELPRVTKRRSEDDVNTEWEKARPGVFGALLDLAAKVHHRLPTVTVNDLPRMADFARLLAAVDEVLGTEGLARYRERAQRSAVDTLDAPLIAELVAAGRAFADITGSALLDALTPKGTDWRRPRGWPKNGRAVTGLLTRHAPALRALGWHVEHDQAANHDKVTRWTISPPTTSERGPKSPPQAPQDPQPQVDGPFPCGSGENPFPAAPADNPQRGEHAGNAGNAENPDPQHLGRLTCENGQAGNAGQKSALSLVDGTRLKRGAQPLVTGPGRCYECGCHIELQGHKVGCSAGVA